MPSDITKSDVAALLPSPSGSRCSGFQKLVNFPNVLLSFVSYFFDDSGNLSDQFKDDICDLGCTGGGGGTPNPSMPAPTLTSASDGSQPTSVDLLWTTVVPSGGSDNLKYNIYRLATDDPAADPTTATLIATVDAPTVSYNDASVVVGTVYRYWIKSTNGTLISSFSNGDFGHASEPATTMDAVSDLQATQGFYSSTQPAQVNLVFTPPAGATKFSLFRNTTNDFETATEVITDITAQDTSTHYVSTQSPDQCWDNVDTILIVHFPPSQIIKYYFWVTCAKDSPPAVSPESNASQGWSATNYPPYAGGITIMNPNQVYTEGVDFTGTHIRVIAFGPGGAGAGGSQNYGGGGGGGGPVIIEEFVLSASDTIEFTSDPDDDETISSPALTNGEEFNNLEFKINGVTKITCQGGHAGEFDPSGGGDGGLGETGTGYSYPTIFDGHDGLPAVGSAGGRSGYCFGAKRIPAAHYSGYAGGGFSGDGQGNSGPGSGTSASPGAEVLAVGGKGKRGYVIFAYGT